MQRRTFSREPEKEVAAHFAKDAICNSPSLQSAARSAYKAKKVPRLDGRVLSVSADILSDQASGERYFLTRTLVDDSILENLKADVALYPGMPAQVFFIAGERTVATISCHLSQTQHIKLSERSEGMNFDLGPTLFLILLIAPTLVYDFYYFVKHRKNKDKLPTFSDYWLFYYSKKGWVMNFRPVAFWVFQAVWVLFIFFLF